MDRVTEGLVSEFSSSFGISTLPIDKQFEQFATYLCVRKVFHEEFNPADLVFGEGGDGGIDAIAVTINGSLVYDIDDAKEIIETAGQIDVSFNFIQATTSAKMEAAKIGTFGFGVEDFFSDKPKLVQSEGLKAAFELMNFIYSKSAKFRGVNPALRLFYVSTGKKLEDTNVETRRDSNVISLIETSLFRSVTFELVGVDQISKYYSEAKNSIRRVFPFDNKTTIPAIPGVEQAYLGFLPGTVFKSIISDEEGNIVKSIFYDNVRDWLGENNTINQGIQQTLSGDRKPMFVLMNNGITIIARTLSITANNVTIEDFQIVNGCQTSHSIYACRDQVDDSIKIPVRIISTQDESIISAIIEATNKQTKVENSQFFAITEFSKKLEAYCQTYKDEKAIFYERRANQYGFNAPEKARIINQRNLVNSFASMFLDEAHSTTRNHRSLESRMGTDIFAQDHELEPYYVAALTFYRIEYLFRNGRLESKYKPARFNLIHAAKLLAIGESKIIFNSRLARTACDPLKMKLWKVEESEALFAKAATIVDHAAAGNWHRDNIREKQFTDTVRKLALA